MNDRIYGASAAEMGWVPSPGYLLRRNRIIAIAKGLKRGHVLEIGCGAGALLNDLAQMGYACTALETSTEATNIARYINRENESVQVQDTPGDGWQNQFDYVFAFEVLEHIEDDQAALNQWREWLKPGGQVMISVPAHQKRWNASDVWAGHVRRYEKKQLIDLFTAGGFSIEHFECYGFPLANIIEPIRARYHARQLSGEMHSSSSTEMNQQTRTARSGIKRSLEGRLYPLLKSPPGRLAMKGCFSLQSLFSSTDMGTGFLLLAQNKA